jgi:ABC-type glycerol-3-phosphate transport system substrate-binding protein
MTLALAVLLTFSLAACGGGGWESGSDETTVAQMQAQPPSNVAPPSESPDGSGGELILCGPLSEPYNSGWMAALEEFGKESGIKVKTDFLPWAQLQERQTLELAGGSGSYDVVYAHPLWWRQFASLGYLQPIDNYTTEEDRALFVPSLLETYRHEDGHIYGLPDWISTVMIAYRTDLFEEKGLPAPQSFDDVLEAAKILNEGNMSGVVFPALNTAGLGGSYVTALLANGGWVADENNNPTMDTPEALETMQFFERLGHYAPDGITNFQWEEVFGVGAGGKAAMAFMLSIRLAEFNDPETSQVPNVWDYVALKNKTSAAAIDSWIWAVTTGSKNQEVAGELVKFLTSTDSQILMSEINHGTAGATIEFYERPEVPDVLPFISAMSAAVEESSKGMPDWESWASEIDALEINMQRMFLGELTPEEVCAAVQEVMIENRK